MEINYEEDLKIDAEALDIEWLDQASKMMKYAELSARAEADAKRADEFVKTLRSELIKEAHEELDKPTAMLVEAHYRTKKEYKNAKRQLIEATHEAEVLRQAVFAISARRAALENLVKLHGQNYFAGPTEPRSLGVEIERRGVHNRASQKVKDVRRGRTK